MKTHGFTLIRVTTQNASKSIDIGYVYDNIKLKNLGMILPPVWVILEHSESRSIYRGA